MWIMSPGEGCEPVHRLCDETIRLFTADNITMVVHSPCVINAFLPTGYGGDLRGKDRRRHDLCLRSNGIGPDRLFRVKMRESISRPVGTVKGTCHLQPTA